MSTTELVVEQLIIGALVVVAAVALVSPDLLSHAVDVELGGVLGILAAVYLAGIVYDRVGDTLVQDMERHARLWFGLRDGGGPVPTQDPYPEETYRMKVLTTDGANSYSEYLKTRLRLSRALATLSPALAMGALVLLTQGSDAEDTIRYVALGAVLVAYALAFAVKQSPWPALRGYIPPRTDDLLDEPKYNGYVRLYRAKKGGPDMWSLLLGERLLWLAAALTVMGVALAVESGCLELIAVPLVGLTGALLAGWVWWRILKTFFGLLRDVSKASI